MNGDPEENISNLNEGLLLETKIHDGDIGSSRLRNTETKLPATNFMV
jgi:hypothetical protein